MRPRPPPAPLLAPGAQHAPPVARRWALVGLGLGLVALGATAVVWNLPRVRAVVTGTPSVLITSEPPGAAVRIGGQVVGTTPYAASNVWVGPVPVELRLPGHVTARATFQGGTEQRVAVKLKRAR